MNRRNQFFFAIKGMDYYLLILKNVILSLLTLGFYIPWAIVADKKFLYSSISLADKNVQYHGEGKDILIGYFKFLALFIAFTSYIAFLISNQLFDLITVSFVGVYALLIMSIPYVIHNSWKYDTSKTSYRGKHFLYTSEFKPFFMKFIKESALLMVTCFIYFPWYVMNLSRHLYNHTKIGNIDFKFTGEGKDVFFINLKGILLIIVTFGIYFHWWIAALHRYHYDNLKMYQDEKEINFSCNLKGSEVLVQNLILMCIIFFTFGLGTPYAILKSQQFFLESLSIEGDIDFVSFAASESNEEQEVDNLGIGMETAL